MRRPGDACARPAPYSPLAKVGKGMEFAEAGSQMGVVNGVTPWGSPRMVNGQKGAETCGFGGLERETVSVGFSWGRGGVWGRGEIRGLFGCVLFGEEGSGGCNNRWFKVETSWPNVAKVSASSESIQTDKVYILHPVDTEPQPSGTCVSVVSCLPGFHVLTFRR